MTWKALIDELMRICCGSAELVSQNEVPWQSATFSGTRHAITLKFSGGDAIPFAEALIERLPRHEFALAGKVVVDTGIVWAERIAGTRPETTLAVSLLVLDDIDLKDAA